MYEGYQQGGDYIDGNTGKVMTFKNIIVLHARTSSDGYRMFADLIGTGKDCLVAPPGVKRLGKMPPPAKKQPESKPKRKGPKTTRPVPEKKLRKSRSHR